MNRQLVSFSRKQNLAPVYVDVETIDQHIRLFLSTEKCNDVEYRSNYNRGALIYADPTYLQSAVLNIVKNSVEAMEGSGIVEMTISVPSEDVVSIRVADSGPGFSSVDLTQALEPFYSNRKNGTGLGLAAVYGFAQQSNGQIHLSNNDGAVVELRLPSKGTALRMDRIDVPKLSTGPVCIDKNMSILFLEDNAELSKINTMLLKKSGFNVAAVKTVKEGVEKLETDTRYQLIVSDIILPDGLGFDLTSLARARIPHCGIIYTTGYGTEQFTHELLKVPGIVIEKPYKIQKLISSIVRVLQCIDSESANREHIPKKWTPKRIQ